MVVRGNKDLDLIFDWCRLTAKDMFLFPLNRSRHLQAFEKS